MLLLLHFMVRRAHRTGTCKMQVAVLLVEGQALSLCFHMKTLSVLQEGVLLPEQH